MACDQGNWRISEDCESVEARAASEEQGTMTVRNRNDGLRKVCDCSRRKWAKCDHPWHFSFKPSGGPAYRFSLDRELGRTIRGKMEAQAVADDLRSQMRNGTFRKRGVPVSEPLAVLPTLTLSGLLDTYERRHVKVERPATAKA